MGSQEGLPKGTSVPLPCGCIAATSVLDSRIGWIGPKTPDPFLPRHRSFQLHYPISVGRAHSSHCLRVALGHLLPSWAIAASANSFSNMTAQQGSNTSLCLGTLYSIQGSPSCIKDPVLCANQGDVRVCVWGGRVIPFPGWLVLENSQLWHCLPESWPQYRHFLL